MYLVVQNLYKETKTLTIGKSRYCNDNITLVANGDV